jgi:RNA polymerase sigma-70 factor (ECF subfamily)
MGTCLLYMVPIDVGCMALSNRAPNKYHHSNVFIVEGLLKHSEEETPLEVMSQSDAITRLRRGDISGLEVLVYLYQSEAYDAAFFITHDHAQAEDVVQGAFLRSFERIQQLREEQSFRPWFLRSVINSAISVANGRYQSSLGALPDEGAQLPSLEPSLEEALEAAETRTEILGALEQLSPMQRAAVVMRYYLDLNDAEVARKLDIPPGTVRRRLHDARRRLRKLIVP